MCIGFVSVGAAEIRKLGAAFEHAVARSHARSAPSISRIDSGERFAVVEHIAHTLHARCVEATNI